ncbi:MAG: phosphoadenylyl-sulfate reductase, partial [Bacteroidales bacterium]|nr:phosphoadenylyl-sulfate reductase [Bacteroidales bacterium]
MQEKYSTSEIERLNAEFAACPPEELLRFFMGKFGGRIALSSSLSIEDQTITDMMLQIDSHARILTL